MFRRSTAFALLLSFLAFLVPSAAEAQVLGTFRWRTEPYCNVITVTVAQNGGVYMLDGYDEQCGGNPRLPIHGIAVMQPNGSITIGFSVVNLPGGLPVNLEASIDTASFSGTWRDSAGSSGSFVFSPASTAGGPRPGAVPSQTLPATFSFFPQGSFLAAGTGEASTIPASGAGRRMMWHQTKAAFRAGFAQGSEWDESSVGFYSAAFGIRTVASGTASFATGVETYASGNQTTALGSYVRSLANGAFVYGDSSTTAPMFAFAPDTFSVRAAGGTRFYSNSALNAGVQLAAGGGAWSSLSDAAMKENLRDLAGETVLSKIAAMPIREWNYTTQDAGIRHVGPTAQDFHAAFGLGEDERRINTIDADGIALAAVKALEARTRALADENRELRERLEQLERLLDRK